MAEPYRRGNKWAFTIDVPRELTGGERKQIQRSSFKTKKEAQQAMVKLLAELEGGSFTDRNTITLAEYLDYFYENFVVVNNKSESTWQHKRYFFNRVSQKPIGRMQLQKIQTHHIQTLITDMIVEQGLKASTVANYMMYFKQAMKMAHKWKFIKSNPMNDVSIPTPEYKEAEPFLPEQIQAMADDIKKAKYSEEIQLAMLTGMRVGEIVALHETDIDYKEQEIDVSKTVLKINGKGIYVKSTPKTQSSKRRIPFDSAVDDLIKKALVKKAKKKLRAGPLFEESGLIFTNSVGKPVNPILVSRCFKNILKKHGLAEMSFHDLRHYQASMLLMLGYDIKVIQKRLGHKKASTTYNVYAHLLPTTGREAAREVEEKFRIS